MIARLYITADTVGTETGGGAVTREEAAALKELALAPALGPGVTVALSAEVQRALEPRLGTTEIWSLSGLPQPWGADDEAVKRLQAAPELKPKVAHFYAGTFSRTIEILKARGCKISYTAAAHDIKISREEHEKLGWPFNYPHLTEPAEWKKYIGGYLAADLVICPSTLSKKCMESYGCKNVVVIPHGVIPPVAIPDLPVKFGVAYLGQPGADKGLLYLLQAWAILRYEDALLTIAGRGTEQILPLVRQHGGGNIHLLGYVERPSDVYAACRVYVQPSASEGFGLEVLEAMAHGRPVICSDGAGAADVATVVVPARKPRDLADAIDAYRREPWRSASDGVLAAKRASDYAWPAIRQKYVDAWAHLKGA